MATDRDPSKLETMLTLRDGRRVRVRSIRPADADMDRAFFAGLSEQSRYMRFMQHLPELTPRLVRQFTQIDDTREMALVALDDTSGDETIVGIARYVVETEDGESAEFAIVLADAWQGYGLGRALMEMLIEGARRRGLRRLFANILAVNAPMRALATSLGFAMHSDPEDGSHVIATLDLASGAKKGLAMLFVNRRQAGTVLAGLLKHHADRSDVLVLALPRGGVPVAFEVARSLNALLDVFVVRKLGVPGHDELAMGAIATGGVRVLNNDVVEHLALSDDVIDRVTARETKELERRERIYRGDYTAPVVHGHTVILVDDGLATGSTMRAAVTALRKQQPARIVVAVPVASPEAYEEIGSEVDEIVCAATPRPFLGVGRWYQDFSQTSDGEVHELLAQARASATS